MKNSAADFQALLPDELALLERDLPDLSEWGSMLLVPFEVRGLARARVAWMNERWFLSRGIDITDLSVRARVDAWLIERFAYAVPREGDPGDAFKKAARTFHADRYGGASAVSKHGGSGRAAVVGRFQIKGIGRTPLASEDVDWVHSHGCASLEEALREAIYGEVLAAESPLGAVPVIAILDTGLFYSRPVPEMPQDELLRRAIIVRPAFVRPAHAERAPMFRADGQAGGGNQVDDVERCRQFISKWLDNPSDDGTYSPVPFMEFLRRLGRQIAFTQVHRLYTGGYFSSNLTVDGQLVDYGGVRPMRTWENARMTHHGPGFGDEFEFVRGMAASLAFHFGKYAPSEHMSITEKQCRDMVQSSYEGAFEHESLTLFGMSHLKGSMEGRRIVQAVHQYMDAQHRRVVTYEKRHERQGGWIHEALFQGGGVPGYADEASCFAAIDAVLGGIAATSGDVRSTRRRAWGVAARLLMYRSEIERDSMQQRIFEAITQGGLAAEPDIDVIHDTINDFVSAGRRHWPALDEALTVHAHVCKDGCSALLCGDDVSSPDSMVIEGVQFDGRLRIFGRWMTKSALATKTFHDEGRQWRARISLDRFAFTKGKGWSLKGSDIVIPIMRSRYGEYLSRIPRPGALSGEATPGLSHITEHDLS